MNRHRVTGSVVLVVVASLAWAPVAGAAGQGHAAAGGHAHGGAGRPAHGGAGGHIIGSRPGFAPHGYGSHHFGSRHFGRPFVSVGVFAAPTVLYAPAPVWYGSPAAYAPSPDYYDLPTGYPQPMAATMSLAPSPAPPPPTPRVVEYPTGRYELRGDGAMTPYTWVWIPNPPPAPPSAPPMDPAASVPAPGVRLSKLYHWTDEEGVVHWTDRRDAVPPQYLQEAKPLAR